MPSRVLDDLASIATRRRALFPTDPTVDAADSYDRERFGSANRHCGICPKPDTEICGLTCEVQRKALNDGVTVT